MSSFTAAKVPAAAIRADLHQPHASQPNRRLQALTPRRQLPNFKSRRPVTVNIMTPDRPTISPSEPDRVEVPPFCPRGPAPELHELIDRASVQELEAELDNGASVKALRRFNDNLANLTQEKWHNCMWQVWNELAYNLESFNPIFTAVLLKIQCTIGHSDYERRDESLRNLIQPLAGEYGMHNGEPMGKTHRKLFSEWYSSCTGASLEKLMQAGIKPAISEHLFACMMRDVSGGGKEKDGIAQASYALGYNLAVEYLAAYEKTWLLDSFKALDSKFLKAEGRDIDWLFLEIHAIGEPEHADLGHQGVVSFVPKSHKHVLRRAMLDHDRDFAEFYNALADMIA